MLNTHYNLALVYIAKAEKEHLPNNDNCYKEAFRNLSFIVKTCEDSEREKEKFGNETLAEVYNKLGDLHLKGWSETKPKCQK